MGGGGSTQDGGRAAVDWIALVFKLRISCVVHASFKFLDSSNPPASVS